MYKIYLFRQTDLLSEEWIKAAMALLPKERRERAMRYRKETDRKNCVIAYLLLKLALWECFGIRKFELGYGVWGKPYVKDWPEAFVNISHCQAGCAVAVADQPVGIDMENVHSFSWETARRVCCEQELQALRKAEDEERGRMFIRMWVRKESYVKWLGTGLFYDVRKVDTTREMGGEVAKLGECLIGVYVELQFAGRGKTGKKMPHPMNGNYVEGKIEVNCF